MISQTFIKRKHPVMGCYFVSLWRVCLLHHLQNLLSSKRSFKVFLFLWLL